MQLQLRSKPLDVALHLEGMDLSNSVFKVALEAGQMGRNSCTANHPPILAGVNAWGWTVYSLREQLMPLGWTKSDAGNYSSVVHPDRRFQIIVATGDENTGNGLLYTPPRTKFKKGPATRAAVRFNRTHFGIQLPLEFAEEIGDEEAEFAITAAAATAPIAPLPTWVMLVSAQGDLVRAELSLPAHVGKDRRITLWQDRLMLPSLEVSGGAFSELPEDLGPTFDPEVRPR